MKRETQKCKGARDLLPTEMQHFRSIENAFIDLCKKWGYQEVRTPTLEYLHLFTSAGTLTPAMLHKVYSFLDWDGWSGERVVLKPDGTIPVARLYLENLSRNKTAKLFYVTNVFLFESTGRENRERWQCGVEYLGNDDAMSDAEIITLAAATLKAVGIENPRLQLCHSGLIRSLLGKMEIDDQHYKKLIKALQQGDREYISRIKGNNSNINNLISLFLNAKGQSTDFLENIKSTLHISKAVRSSLSQFTSITRILDALNCKYQIDISSTDNFEYYTGLSFKFTHNNHIICSGGRYNDLLPIMGGKNIPACGFAIYIDPILKSSTHNMAETAMAKVAIVPPSATSDISQGFHLIQRLHALGYIAGFNLKNLYRDCRWSIEIEGEPPVYTLSNHSHNKKFKSARISEILNMLEVEK